MGSLDEISSINTGSKEQHHVLHSRVLDSHPKNSFRIEKGAKRNHKKVSCNHQISFWRDNLPVRTQCSVRTFAEKKAKLWFYDGESTLGGMAHFGLFLMHYWTHYFDI